jgi:osmotically inducible lipoprotein OsmB
MKLPLIATVTAATLALSGCETTQSRTVIAGGTGAALGALTAEVLADDPAWTVVGALAGAAAGTLVARNTAQQNCAYAVGDGTYRVAPCP